MGMWLLTSPRQRLPHQLRRSPRPTPTLSQAARLHPPRLQRMWLLTSPRQIFSANCAACHAGGNNAIVPEKKLKKEALLQYGKYEIAQIITQVTNGNGAMPAFGEKIAPDDIED